MSPRALEHLKVGKIRKNQKKEKEKKGSVRKKESQDSGLVASDERKRLTREETLNCVKHQPWGGLR